jgi:hypothetical protein
MFSRYPEFLRQPAIPAEQRETLPIRRTVHFSGYLADIGFLNVMATFMPGFG